MLHLLSKVVHILLHRTWTRLEQQHSEWETHSAVWMNRNECWLHSADTDFIFNDSLFY